MNKSNLTLYLVTDRALADAREDGMSLEQIVKQAVEGGVSIVQLREKHLDEAAFIEEGLRFKKLLSRYGVPLIINDNVKVALECGADGVHIGQSDMNYAEARALLGPDKIIGLSIENMAQLEEANLLDVDYVAASPVFSTATKTDTARPWGLDGLREFVMCSKHPVVAIGGINKGNLSEIFAGGADGAAVVSAIVCADSPYRATQELLVARKEWLQDRSCYEFGEFGLIQQIAAAFKDVEGQVPRTAGEEVAKGMQDTLHVDEKGEEVGERITGIGDDCVTGIGDERVTGIGDDCAILPQRSGYHTLVSTDMLIEGTHFILDNIPAWDLGWKSAAVNISDIAAMGGRPVGTFLSIALPKTISMSWVKSFIEGYKTCALRYGAPLLGGDTTSSPDRLCINVTVLGECVPGKSGRPGRAKLRSSARPGDLICVTGELGDSAGGLRVILNRLKRGSIANPSNAANPSNPEYSAANQREIERGGVANTSELKRTAAANQSGLERDAAGNQSVLERDDAGNQSGLERDAAAKRLVIKHYHPVPRVEAGLELATHEGVHAMMDISDGVASDLRHILEASGVSAVIHTDKIPVSEDLVTLCRQFDSADAEQVSAALDGTDAVAVINSRTGNSSIEKKSPTPLELALTGGEDYELLFTVDSKTEKKLGGLRHFVIGEITESGPDGPAIKWIGCEGNFIGFRHF